ncbi:MAG: oxalurate catabolism protein HpxZ [Cyanobacteriota bacterium]|nr:oxalurate catabolism protein HpxZ [Cyanobacteriota bacterium]
MSDINRPDVVAELTALYDQYEKALCSNDIATMTHLFWDSPHVVRFGATENLYGSEELAAFRQHRPAIHLEREILKLQVVSFGETSASITLEFRRVVNGQPRLGRQSQMWQKLAEGWKIVSAHVSFLP